jgi:TonB family protein
LIRKNLTLILAAEDLYFPATIAVSFTGIRVPISEPITLRTDNRIDITLLLVAPAKFPELLIPTSSFLLLKFSQKQKWNLVSFVGWDEFSKVATSERVRIKIASEIIELDESAKKTLVQFRDYLREDHTPNADTLEASDPTSNRNDDQKRDSVSSDSEPPDFVAVQKEPVLVKSVAARYPEIALRAGLEGTVYAKIWVDKEGKVRRVVVLRSDAEIFNQAAVDAAMQWIYTPALDQNGPVSVWVTAPFKFRLSSKE